MKKSQLRELVREILEKGRSNYYPGIKTPGLTPDVFNTILKNVALEKKYSSKDHSEEEDSEQERIARGNALMDTGDIERGNALMDTGNIENGTNILVNKSDKKNVARILRGEKPIYEETSNIKSVNITYTYPGSSIYKIVIDGEKATNHEEAIQTIENLTGLKVPLRAWWDDKKVLAVIEDRKSVV